MTDKTDRVTRAAIERVLQEMTGFRADAAEIARVMVIIDTYAALQATGISEPLLHLLVQQAELLLDSGQSVVNLSESIGELGKSLTARVAQVEQDWERAKVFQPAAEFELSRVSPLTEAERTAVRAALEVPEIGDRVHRAGRRDGTGPDASLGAAASAAHRDRRG